MRASPDVITKEAAAPSSPRSALAMLDQVAVSAAHFMIGVTVARSGSAAALGMFGLAFLVISTAADLHRAVVWLPMSQEAEPAQYRPARRLSVMLGTAAGLLALAFAVFLAATGQHDAAVLAGIVGMAAPFLHLHEIQRRIQFALLRPSRALVADVAYAGAALAAVVFLPAFDAIQYGAAIRGIVALAIASAVGSLVNVALLRGLPPAGYSMSEIRARYGPASKAYAINAGLVFGSQRVSILVIATVLGVEALGNVEAARLLTAPLMVAALGLAALAVPTAAHTLQQGGVAEMHRLLNRVMALSIGAAALYGIALLIGAEAFSQFAFDRVFDHSQALGLIYCGIAAVSLVATTLVAPAGIAGYAGEVPKARLPGVILVLLGSVPAAVLIDERAVLGLVLIEGILTAFLLRRAINRLHPAEPS